MRRLRGLWKIIFGRTTILVLLLFIQVMILFGGFMILDRQILVFNYMCGFLAVIILMYLLNVRQSSKLQADVDNIHTGCSGGQALHFTYIPGYSRAPGSHPGGSGSWWRKRGRFCFSDRAMMEKVYMRRQSRRQVFSDISTIKENIRPMATPASSIFLWERIEFKEMIYQLERARDFHIPWSILSWNGGICGTLSWTSWSRKAREGVEVRFMYDGTCTLSLLPKNYNRRMEALGIKCKIFSPMMPFLATHQNNRDHRKNTGDRRSHGLYGRGRKAWRTNISMRKVQASVTGRTRLSWSRAKQSITSR